MASSPKQQDLLASKDIWKDAGISTNMGPELKKLGITPDKLLKTPSQVGGGRINISDRD